jgi:hypothetical protein
MSIVNFILAGILLVLSGFHFYWVGGGEKGYLAAIPEKFQVKEPTRTGEIKTKIATLIVALGLLSLAFVSFLELYCSALWIIITLRVFGSIFFIRAIGDFNILGLFKKKSDSLFAKYDTRLYIPLCIVLSCCFWVVTFG